MRYIILAILALSLTACYNSDDAIDAAHKAGLKDVEVTGHDWFACSEDDFYSTGFTATNAQGERVEGTACSGFFFKGTTIRW